MGYKCITTQEAHHKYGKGKKTCSGKQDNRSFE
jgi:hypothetical protein